MILPIDHIKAPYTLISFCRSTCRGYNRERESTALQVGKTPRARNHGTDYCLNDMNDSSYTDNIDISINSNAF